jgi:hypothetical protein
MTLNPCWVYYYRSSIGSLYLELFAGGPDDPESLLGVILEQHRKLGWNCNK